MHEHLQTSHVPYRDHITRGLIHPVAVEWTTVDQLHLAPAPVASCPSSTSVTAKALRNEKSGSGPAD